MLGWGPRRTALSSGLLLVPSGIEVFRFSEGNKQVDAFLGQGGSSLEAAFPLAAGRGHCVAAGEPAAASGCYD